MIEADTIGRIIEVNSGFVDSSHPYPDKPINWKRMPEYNGEYGCLGDLGTHRVTCRFGLDIIIR